MQREGFEFFRSANGVWLTKKVPVEYLEKSERAFFQIRIYELPEEYVSNGWDVTEDILTEDTVMDMVQGIPRLEETLCHYLADFSVLVPEWQCENPL